MERVEIRENEINHSQSNDTFYKVLAGAAVLLFVGLISSFYFINLL